MSARAAFKQADVERACKGMLAAVLAAGLPVAGVEFNDNGVSVLVGEGTAPRRKNKADELYGPKA